MFNWLRNWLKPQDTKTEPVETPRRKGFFSTDVQLKRKGTVFDTEKVLAQSFQVTAPAYAASMDSAAGMAIAQDATAGAKFSGAQQNIPESQMMWYAAQGFIGYQACAMLAQNWLIDKACSQPGVDAVRNGYVVSVDNGDEADAELIEAIRTGDERYGVKAQMEQLVHFGRVFGIRHVLFVYDCPFDPEYYEKPFNPDSVTPGSYRGMSQIDPYWITPELDADAVANPASRHFYVPTYWRISGKRYHRSHFVIMIDKEVADVLKPSYIYGGVSLPQRIYERVYAAERCANESPQLLLSKRATAIHVDMEAVVANPIAFEAKMQDWTHYRDNFGIKIMGSEETMEVFDTTLSDLDETIMTQYQLVAAIADVPATKLLGTSPKGFNATGEYEESNYHESLESIQEHDCTPLLKRHHIMMMRSDIAPQFNIAPLPLNVVWNPLDTPTAKEEAETNLAKAQTGAALVASGAIDGADERARITADPASGYAGLPELEDGDLTDEEFNDLVAEVLPNGEESDASAVN